jgi:AraC-like DNA-binding protein
MLSDLNEAVKITEEINSYLLENNKFDSVCKLCELLSYIKSNVTSDNRKETRIAAVKKYIDTNFSDNITLDTLSTIFYLHPVYLQRKFKQEYDLSPTDYIVSVRIKHAKNYLISTNMTIEEISYKVGFSYPSYFIKVFKRIVQITPFKYKKQMLSNN